MRNSLPVQSSDAVVEEASLWVARLDRGLGKSELPALERFLAQPGARQTFVELAAVSDQLNELSVLAVQAGDKPARGRRLAPPWAIAASVVFAMVLAGALYIGTMADPRAPVAQEAMVAYETLVGEQSFVKLPDGSELSLNTDSRVRVDFTGSGRLAVLDRGEAHFDIAKDPSRPFNVRAGAYLVQVTGTRFSVYRRSPEATEVVVSEGSVRVLKAGPGGRDPRSGNDPSGSALRSAAEALGAGAIGVFTDAEARVESVDPETLRARLAWREGKLVFQGETLDEALTEIGRYTNTRFEFLDDRARQLTVAGVFRSGDVDGLLETIAVNFGVSYQRLAPDLILISLR